MKKLDFKIVLATILLTMFLTCQAEKPVHVLATNPNIAYIGRVSFKNPESPCFTYPGVQIRALFQGTSLKMKVKPNSGYFMVEIDNREPFKVASLENDSIIELAAQLSDSVHQVIITLAYEGHIRRPEFRGFILDPGKKLPTKPILPKRKIEFIGNSITCGYGTEVTDPKAPFKDETENHYYTYAATTARALNAQSLVVARSGIGMYRNYDGPIEGARNCMPYMYNQTLFGDSTELWNFACFSPDIVCINLGTNDVSTSGYDIVRFTNASRAFLQHVRDKYPQAKIVLLTGCMLADKKLQDVQGAFDTVMAEAHAAGNKEVYRFDLSPQDGSLGFGASWHPSRKQQEKSAAELIPFIRTLMGWSDIN